MVRIGTGADERKELQQMDSFSIENSISRESIYEGFSMMKAVLDDAASRYAAGIKPVSISNEQIQKEDEILETYRVMDDAIHGGMGSVWRVHHQGWNVDLAMKRPQPKFFAEGSEKRKEGFIAECEHWISLGLHPNIVSCYYVRDIGGVPTVFSEWMSGGSLKDRIDDDTLYKGSSEQIQKRILKIAIQSAGGLQYAHLNALIHQDVKPGNLLLTGEQDVKVADFGLARATLQSDRQNAGLTGGYTPAYCPQEQMNGEKPARWMDIYSWALTVLEMYAGRRLWNTGAEAGQHFEEYIPACRYPVPDEMQSLLRSCLTEKPAGFVRIERQMKTIWHRVTGEEYPDNIWGNRSVLTADALNNYALSMMDLGCREKAYEYWENALKTSPNHFYTSFNLLMAKWYDGTLDDLHLIARLREIDRILDNADTARALRLAQECRGCDELIRKIPFDAKKAECLRILSEKHTSFEYTDETQCTKLTGTNPRNKGIDSSPGSMKLYDLKTGRCIRTTMYESDDYVPVSFEERYKSNFGEAVMQPENGTYCYPDASHTTLYYRRPDMTSRPPAWLLSKVLPYSEQEDRQRRLNRLIREAEKAAGEKRMEEACSRTDEAWELAGTDGDERLRTLNRKLANACVIRGIRGYSRLHTRDRYELPTEIFGRYYDMDNPVTPLIRFEEEGKLTKIVITSRKGANRFHRTVTILNRGTCYSLKFSKNGKQFSFLQHCGEDDGDKRFYLVDWSNAKVLSHTLTVRGGMHDFAPDGDTVVTFEKADDFDRCVHVYSLRAGKEIRTIPIRSNTYDAADSIEDACFREDSRAVFILREGEYVTMLELDSGKEYVFWPDISRVEKWDGFSCEDIVSSGPYVCCKNGDAYDLWEINYRYTAGTLPQESPKIQTPQRAGGFLKRLLKKDG